MASSSGWGRSCQGEQNLRGSRIQPLFSPEDEQCPHSSSWRVTATDTSGKKQRETLLAHFTAPFLTLPASSICSLYSAVSPPGGKEVQYLMVSV